MARAIECDEAAELGPLRVFLSDASFFDGGRMDTVMAYIVMAYTVMAYIVMAYTVMAYIVMAV